MISSCGSVKYSVPSSICSRSMSSEHEVFFLFVAFDLQSCPSSFPRAALLTTLRVCVRIWDGVGFGVRVSTIKRSKSNYLVNIFVSHRVVPYDDKNSRRFISDSIDHLILSYSTWRSFARNASARTTIRLSCHKVKLRSSRDIQPCFTMSSQVMLISNLNLSLDFENPKHSGF